MAWRWHMGDQETKCSEYETFESKKSGWCQTWQFVAVSNLRQKVEGGGQKSGVSDVNCLDAYLVSSWERGNNVKQSCPTQHFQKCSFNRDNYLRCPSRHVDTMLKAADTCWESPGWKTDSESPKIAIQDFLHLCNFVCSFWCFLCGFGSSLTDAQLRIHKRFNTMWQELLRGKQFATCFRQFTEHATTTLPACS